VVIEWVDIIKIIQLTVGSPVKGIFVELGTLEGGTNVTIIRHPAELVSLDQDKMTWFDRLLLGFLRKRERNG
jgi:hypothetical protein